jgi:hypothetical protein
MHYQRRSRLLRKICTMVLDVGDGEVLMDTQEGEATHLEFFLPPDTALQVQHHECFILRPLTLNFDLYIAIVQSQYFMNC